MELQLFAKAGFQSPFEPVQHRDPVTGQVKEFRRDKHARQSSPGLIAHKQCVADKMRGFKASGSNARERSMSIRNALSQASKGCRGSGRRTG
jgi:hypothetical protein